MRHRGRLGGDHIEVTVLKLLEDHRALAGRHITADHPDPQPVGDQLVGDVAQHGLVGHEDDRLGRRLLDGVDHLGDPGLVRQHDLDAIDAVDHPAGDLHQLGHLHGFVDRLDLAALELHVQLRQHRLVGRLLLRCERHLAGLVDARRQVHALVAREADRRLHGVGHHVRRTFPVDPAEGTGLALHHVAELAGVSGHAFRADDAGLGPRVGRGVGRGRAGQPPQPVRILGDPVEGFPQVGRGVAEDRALVHAEGVDALLNQLLLDHPDAVVVDDVDIEVIGQQLQPFGLVTMHDAEVQVGEVAEYLVAPCAFQGGERTDHQQFHGNADGSQVVVGPQDS